MPITNLWPTVYALLEDQWQQRIPAESRAAFEAINQFDASTFKAARNAIMDVLVNKIGRTLIKEAIVKNPLSFIPRQSLAFGDTVEEIMTDIITAKHYDPNGTTDPWKKEKPNVYAFYHRENRMDTYKTTTQPSNLNRAFTGEAAMGRLLTSIVNELTKSNAYDTFLYTKQLFRKYANNTVKPLLPSQTVNVNPIVDQASGERFLMAVQNAIYALSFPTRAYNPTGIMSMTAPEELYCFVRATVLPILNVEVMSHAFNKDEVLPRVRIIPIDDFGDPSQIGAEDEVCWLMDKDIFLIFEQLLDQEMLWNPEGLYYNHWLHVQELYSMSLMHNALRFVVA